MCNLFGDTLRAAIALFIASSLGCGEKHDSVVCGSLADMSDSEIMFLIGCLPIGATYAEARKIVPNLSELRWEGRPLNRFGLQEATASVAILDHQSELEINFKDSRLYSYLFWVRDLTEKSAESLYNDVVGVYSASYGAPTTTTDAEPGHTYSGSHWCQNGYAAVVGRTDYADRSFVAWGFQNRCP